MDEEDMQRAQKIDNQLAAAQREREEAARKAAEQRAAEERDR